MERVFRTRAWIKAITVDVEVHTVWKAIVNTVSLYLDLIYFISIDDLSAATYYVITSHHTKETIICRVGLRIKIMIIVQKNIINVLKQLYLS